MKKLCIAILSLAAIASAWAQLEVNVPLNRAASLTTDFDAPAWKGAGVIDGFDKMGSNLSVMGMEMKEAVSQRIIVRLVRDDKALYIGFECFDDDIENLGILKGFNHAKWPIGDKMEIFLDGDLTEKNSFYHFVFNVDGDRVQQTDKQMVEPGDWTVETAVKENQWRGVIRIPYAAIGITADAAQIRGMFFRDYHSHRSGEGKAERHTWGGRAINTPKAFGDLIFTGETP